MKLERVLDQLNSFEKNAFLKIIDTILAGSPQNQKEVDAILSGSEGLKNADNQNIAKVFALVEDEFIQRLKDEFLNTSSQLDILIDIVSREGNAIMKIDWFARLYEQKVALIKKRIRDFEQVIDGEAATEIDESRIRDYRIYRGCVETAYGNDVQNNQDKKITQDELSILLTLAKQLELSQEEIKLLNYQIVPIATMGIDEVVSELRSIGVVFFSKKSNTIFVADEMVSVLRKVRGKEVADKYVRRVLRLLREPQINMVCKKHGIDRKLELDAKVKAIIEEGIGISVILGEDVHKPGTTLTERKKFLNEFCDTKLGISPALKGVTLEEKIGNLIQYFNHKEREDKVGISIDGYDRLLRDIGTVLPEFNDRIRMEYQFQEQKVLDSQFLLNYNIKPRDVVEWMGDDELVEFCKQLGIKTRGDVYLNLLDAYTDSENLFLENYPLIAFRDVNGLKEQGVDVKEVDLGLKFEELTGVIFGQLGFDVSKEVLQEVNTAKDKADLILRIGESDIILVECKTSKESGYNKFSSVSRQLKSYAKRAEEKGYRVVKSLLVAPEFSDEFVKECGLEYELNLSLISAGTLLAILEGFKASKLKSFPHNLLMRDVVIQEDRVLKAMGR